MSQLADVRVLVIDSDRDMRSYLEMLLSDRYRLTLCASAAAGVDSFSSDVAVVIIEPRMSPRDGFWACAEIRKRSQEVPVIFFSAEVGLMDAYEIINRYHPFAYVRKSGDYRQLIDAIGSAMQFKRA